MIPTKYLLDHIDALLRLSHDIKDRTVSAKLREMADEFRIMVSVADITELAAGLNKAAGSNENAPPTPDLMSTDAASVTTIPKPKRQRKKRSAKSAAPPPAATAKSTRSR
jgi:hypothetical protein